MSDEEIENSLTIESCTERLSQWLNQCHYSDANYGTERKRLQYIAAKDPYNFASNELSQEHDEGQGVLYWALIRHTYLKGINSLSLRQSFHFVETAPLLCILDDFLKPLDDFLYKYEKRKKRTNTSKDDGQTMNREGTDQDGAREGDERYETDIFYLEGLELYCLLNCRLLNMKHLWRIVIDQALPNQWKGFVEAHHHLMINAISKLVSDVKSIIQTCYEDRDKPRFVQLCEKLDLTEKEKEAMIYIFMQNAGVMFARLHNRYSSTAKDTNSISGNHSNSMALAAATFSSMNGQEMYEFFSEERSHLQQELFGSEDEFSSLLNSAFLQMPPTVTKACCGCSLSADELYKVDKTVLAEVISAERQKLHKDKKDKEEDKTREEEKESEEKDIQDEELVELEQILRACDDIQQNIQEDEDYLTGEDKEQPKPYKTDLEYLEDNFELIETLVKARKTETSDDVLIMRPDQRRPEAVLREMKAKGRGLKAKIEQRMEATRKAGAWLPRLERLAELRRLNKFEKNALLTLTGCMVSRNLRDSGNSDSVFRHHINIGMLIGLFCEGLEEQIKARVYFYRNSHLVREGLLHVSDPPLLSRGNFLDCGVELDRRLLDYIVGLDTEMNELVDGSDLYTPDTLLSDVALPAEQRQLLLNTFDSFEKFQKTCKDLKLNTHGCSKGLCILFYGPSGTGKTMTANAVANYLGKKLLLVTVSLLTDNQINKDLLKFIFREAKIHNAIIFLDECEPIFESRDNRTNTSLALMLTEIEQYDGIIILATNRHQDLDEAMHRRIQLALPFSVPDYTLRKEIWKSHVPPQLLKDEAGMDWAGLAQSYELTGGLIRNAMLSSIALASKRTFGDDSISLTFEDLYNGAKLQLRGLLEMVDFERRVIPTFGLEEVVLEESVRKIVDAILNTGKTHKFISTQWGFAGGVGTGENVAQASGVITLLYGPAGVGKTSVAHAIAYELGQPIKEANCSELLSHTVTTNPRASKGIATFFHDAQRANAIVVLDGAEFILGFVSGSLVSGIIGCETYSLAYQIERYPGIVILTSRQEASLLDINKLPHLRYIVPLRPPSVNLREQIWKKLLPKKAPVAAGIEFQKLAETYMVNGGQIATIICSAAEKAAGDGIGKGITTTLLCQATEEQLSLQLSGRNEHLSAIFQ